MPGEDTCQNIAAETEKRESPSGEEQLGTSEEVPGQDTCQKMDIAAETGQSIEAEKETSDLSQSVGKESEKENSIKKSLCKTMEMGATAQAQNEEKAVAVEAPRRSSARSSRKIIRCDIEGMDCKNKPTFGFFGSPHPNRCKEHRLPGQVPKNKLGSPQQKQCRGKQETTPVEGSATLYSKRKRNEPTRIVTPCRTQGIRRGTCYQEKTRVEDFSINPTREWL